MSGGLKLETGTVIVGDGFVMCCEFRVAGAETKNDARVLIVFEINVWEGGRQIGSKMTIMNGTGVGVEVILL